MSGADVTRRDPRQSPVSTVAHHLRDLGVLTVVVGLLGGVLWSRSRVEHPIPVTFGHDRIANVEEIAAEADDRFNQLVQSAGGKVAEGAHCYFYRPMGPTGVLPKELMPPGLLQMIFQLMGGNHSDSAPSQEDIEGIDMMACGPALVEGDIAEMGQAVAEEMGVERAPWASGIVAYERQPDGSYRGTVSAILPRGAMISEINSLTLLSPEGHRPDDEDLKDPTWREVEGNGEPVEGLPGTETPELPEGPELPDAPEQPEGPALTVPEMPALPEAPSG